jgi:hypothetical protein
MIFWSKHLLGWIRNLLPSRKGVGWKITYCSYRYTGRDVMFLSEFDGKKSCGDFEGERGGKRKTVLDGFGWGVVETLETLETIELFFLVMRVVYGCIHISM